MNLEETNAFVTWINQHDPLVSNAMAAVDIWQNALDKFPIPLARQAIMDHYRLNEKTPAEASSIRKRCIQLQTLTKARTSARTIEPPKPAHTSSWRERNPELWEQNFTEGQRQRNMQEGAA